MSLVVVYGQEHEIENWVARNLPYVKEAGFGPAQSLGICKESEIIAGVIYHRFLGHDIEMSIYTTSPKWCSKRILKLIFEYPFIQLGVKRITATIPVSYHKAHRLVTNLGFQKEGRMRYGFDQEDAVIYGLLKEECHFIEERENG